MHSKSSFTLQLNLNKILTITVREDIKPETQQKAEIDMKLTKFRQETASCAELWE